MKKVLFTLIAAVAMLSMVATTQAAGHKQVTLTGKLTCAKCDLSETPKCQNVLIVKDGDKEVKYYMVTNKVNTHDTHKKVCKGAKDGVTVTGIVHEKDGKKMLVATKIEGL